MNVKPIGARILIEEIKEETVTKSGIYLPGNEKVKTQMAKVLEVGEGTEKEKILVKKGDTVVYSQYAGTSIKAEDKNYKIVNMEDILAVVED